MAKSKTRDFFAWSNDEVELQMKVTYEYKAMQGASDCIRVAVPPQPPLGGTTDSVNRQEQEALNNQTKVCHIQPNNK